MADTNRSLDNVYGALAHQHRRRALIVLADHDTSLTLSDLANEITSRDHDLPVDDLPEEAVKTVHLNFYHQHIPKLAEAGLMEYDRATNFVDLTDVTRPLLSTLLEVQAEKRISQC